MTVMAPIDPTAAHRREEARDRLTGEFGEHQHTAPDIELTADTDVEPDTWTPVYDMPLSHVTEAKKRIERANRRLARAGVEERFSIDVEEYVHIPEGEAVGIAAARVTLNTPQLSIGGWKFSAAHEMTADGHIVNYGPAKVEEMRCDHCGHARRRGKVFTVINEQGERKVVGSNCLTAFLGIRPEGLWSLTFDLEAKDDEEERDVWSGATGDKVVPALDLVGAALAASKDGMEFVPKSRASIETPSTASVVEKDLSTMVAAGEEPERRAQAETILAWVNAQPDGDSDYIDNLRSVLAGKERWVGRKHFGIGVSAVSAYRNAQEWAARDAQKREEAEALYRQGHLGEIGVRFRDRPMTLQVADVRDGGEWGPTTRMVFRDDETGRQVIWWASGDRSHGLSEGDSVTLTATVSEHSDFQGADQTVVKRGKLTFPDGE